MSAGPELSSINTALSTLTDRITGMAESLAGTQRDDLAAALYEVERSLRNAQRRLDKVVDSFR
ncbi:MAG: hypothetical protein QOI47_365 [Actinomycetota bacterium]|jgi:hypothetical protein|nr:hypothetical protein [Actinomycetota bacterium]